MQQNINHETHNHNTFNINAGNNSVEKTLEGLGQQIKKLQKENENYDLMVTMLKKELANLTAENERLKSSNQNPSNESEEIKRLKAQLVQAEAKIAKLESEIVSHKTDVENFKTWTKKLDWSTTEQPLWLDKHFNILIQMGRKGTATNGNPFTVIKEQTVDGISHGPNEWINDKTNDVYVQNDVDGEPHGIRRITYKGQFSGTEEQVWWMGKNLNKTIRHLDDESKMYYCADIYNNGVSVGVKTKDGQKGGGYSLKNGYCITLYIHKNEIRVKNYVDSKVANTKWYQLKP
jgi:hypothetical protein